MWKVCWEYISNVLYKYWCENVKMWKVCWESISNVLYKYWCENVKMWKVCWEYISNYIKYISLKWNLPFDYDYISYICQDGVTKSTPVKIQVKLSIDFLSFLIPAFYRSNAKRVKVHQKTWRSCTFVICSINTENILLYSPFVDLV